MKRQTEVSNSERRKNLERELNRIVGMLEREYHPNRIMLFGSLVRGETKAWSDIDLVIIKPTKKRFMERAKEVALLTKPRVGVDFFVYTPGEFEEMTSEEGTFQREEMLKKGKVIYDKG
jgi:predicted nucleotidyltransferase